MNVQDEAAPYYSGYINLVTGDNILQTLETQLDGTLDFYAGYVAHHLTVLRERYL